MARLSAAALLVAACAFAPGCDVVTSVGPQTCDRDPEDNPPTLYTEGTVEGGVYMSSPWDGELVHFPGGTQVRFVHHLGAMPRTWTAYVSFDRYGSEGPMAPVSGNQAELVEATDEAIVLRNSSCADYYILVTAQAEVASET